jgi:hypothetical protein
MCKKITTEKFILKAHKIHNNRYDYSSSIYVSAKGKVFVKCKIHGKFCVSPDNHIGKASGCPKCRHSEGGKKIALKLRGRSHNNFSKTIPSRKENFLNEARRIHGNRYDYSKVIYKSNKTRIIIVCKVHGDFKSQPLNHLHSKIGCPVCVRENRRTSKDGFITQANEIHNKKYDYTEVNYISGAKGVSIICPIHGRFLQKPVKHLGGHGCQKCNSSHGERLIRKWLIYKNIDFNEQMVFENCTNPKTKRKLKFDFYIKSNNSCIEFDGEQHFRPSRDGKITAEKVIEIQIRDKIKNDFCQMANISLLRIPYTKLNKIDIILNNFFIPQL